MGLPFSTGFVFTNALGEVVFSDRGFLRLTKRSTQKPPIEGSLPATLGAEQGSASQFLQDLYHQGVAEQPALPIRTSTGSLRSVRAAGVAVFSGREGYIGADIQLAPSLPHSTKDVTFPRCHADVLDNYARQMLEESRQLKSRTFLQVYLTVQIDAIQVLLARLGGPDMRAAFERIIHATAVGGGIPAIMQHGYLEFAGKTVPLGAYQALFHNAMGYAISGIGKRLVAEEIRLVDQRIDPGVLKAARLLDLTIDGDD